MTSLREKARVRKSAIGIWLAGLALIAIALVGGEEAFLVLQSPGREIRRELAAASAEVGRLSWSTPAASSIASPATKEKSMPQAFLPM